MFFVKISNTDLRRNKTFGVLEFNASKIPLVKMLRQTCFGEFEAYNLMKKGNYGLER